MMSSKRPVTSSNSSVMMSASENHLQTNYRISKQNCVTAWNRINDLVKKVAELERELAARSEQQMQVLQLESDLEEVSSNLVIAEDQIIHLTEELHNERSQQIRYQFPQERELQEISSKLASAEEQITVLTEQLDKCQRQNQQLQQQKHQLEGVINQQISELNKNFDEGQERVNEQQIRELKKKFEEQLMQQKFDYKDIIAGVTEDLSKSQNELKMCDSRLKQCKEDMNEWKRATEDCQNELATCQDKFERCKIALQRTNEKLEEIESIHRRCPKEQDNMIVPQKIDQLEQRPPSQSNSPEQADHLQNVVQSFEFQLQSLKDLTESFKNLSPRSQEVNAAESDLQLKKVTEEFEHVKTKLEKMMTDYSDQLKLNSKLKLHAETEYNQLSRKLKSEQTQYQEREIHLEKEVRFVRAAFEKEKEISQRAEVRNEELRLEHREMLILLTDQSQKVMDSQRQVSLLQDKSERLEVENTRLQERIDLLSKRVHKLDCIRLESSLNQDILIRRGAI